jgi:hypothetical protein
MFSVANESLNDYNSALYRTTPYIFKVKYQD